MKKNLLLVAALSAVTLVMSAKAGSLAAPDVRFFDPATLPLDTADGLPAGPTFDPALLGLMRRIAFGDYSAIGTSDDRNKVEMGILKYENLLRSPTSAATRYTLWKSKVDGGPDYGNMVSTSPVQIVSPEGVEVLPKDVNVKVEGFRWNGSAWVSVGVLRNVTLSSLGDARWVSTAGPDGIAGNSDDVRTTDPSPSAPAKILSYGGPAINVVAQPGQINATLASLRNGAYTFRTTVTLNYKSGGETHTLVRWKDVTGGTPEPTNGIDLIYIGRNEWSLLNTVVGSRYILKKSPDLQTWTNVTTYVGTGGNIDLGAIMQSDTASKSRQYYKVEQDSSLPPVPSPGT